MPLTTTAGAAQLAERLLASGLVQGVGFRPAVHRLATRLGLVGWVRNTPRGVEIALEGAPAAIAQFRRELPAALPPLARLDRLEPIPATPEGAREFRILPSHDEGGGEAPVSPDVAMCPACAAELADPANRRHGHPFITCTDCGPRYTIIEAMPYDRERTSMRAFPPCTECAAEYDTPGDRRFHSETNSCPACGPTLWLEDASGRLAHEGTRVVIGHAAERLRAGQVLAVRGLGGFHLAVDATNPDAVARLRQRKHREAKPLAVMVRDLEAARRLATLSAAEAALLTSAQSPIVVARMRTLGDLAPAVAPGLDRVGIMLPTTPLHALLVEAAGRPLVMTSGNASEEPIATGLAEARHRLAGIADAFLLHDREITSRHDDSVVRLAGSHAVLLRRARGYAPLPLELPVPSPVPLLAVGPHLKNTFTLASGRSAWVSQHIGDLESLESLEHFRATLAHLSALFHVEPAVVVRDMHPGYLSSRLAEQLDAAHLLEVQHHHAHVAAVLAEHAQVGPAVGLAFDGTGWGPDGTVWGGECLVADLRGYRRVGWLRPAPLPGGDLAARRPWRAALGYASLADDIAAFEPAFQGVDRQECAVVERQVATGLNTPLASSMGRLFDAAASILGLRREVAYEGQAAMELEALAGDAEPAPLPFPLRDVRDGLELDPIPLLQSLGVAVREGTPPAVLAAGFHQAVADGAVRMAHQVAKAEGLDTVALSGGVFQNARLLLAVEAGLRAEGLTVLAPRLLGPNDGAISYGQAAVAAATLAGNEEALKERD